MTSERTPQIDEEFAAAIFARDWPRCAELLTRGAQINRTISRTETFDRDVVEETTTYLIDAAMAGDVERMGFLLRHGADPQIASAYSGRTALLAAAAQEHAAAVDLLLTHGANVAAVDHYNKKTATDYAVMAVNPVVARSLLAAGAQGSFARLGFSIEGGATAREVVRLLVDHGVSINEVDDWGRTPLMWAAQYAEAETVRFMIELGADVNRVSTANMNGVESHETALGLALERRRGDVAELLRSHGAMAGGGTGRSRGWKALFRWP